jgi:hypothetical protein
MMGFLIIKYQQLKVILHKTLIFKGYFYNYI